MYYVSAPGIEELAINVQIIIIIMANIFNPNARMIMPIGVVHYHQSLPEGNKEILRLSNRIVWTELSRQLK